MNNGMMLAKNIIHAFSFGYGTIGTFMKMYGEQLYSAIFNPN